MDLQVKQTWRKSSKAGTEAAAQDFKNTDSILMLLMPCWSRDRVRDRVEVQAAQPSGFGQEECTRPATWYPF